MCFILHGIEKTSDSTLPEAPSQFSIHRHANHTTRLWPWSRRKRRKNPSRQRQTPPAPKRRLWPMGNGRYARAFGSTQCPIFLACVEQSVCRKKRGIFITKCIIAWFFLDVKQILKPACQKSWWTGKLAIHNSHGHSAAPNGLQRSLSPSIAMRLQGRAAYRAYVFSTIFTRSWLTVSSAWAVMHSSTPCQLRPPVQRFGQGRPI